jgi:hypothetical protein
MKKLLLGVLMLGGLALANGPASAQTFQNGPYYANPSWDQQIPAAQRFIVLTNWNNEAVLDRETGLVWQRAPALSGEHNWFFSIDHCNAGTIIGNRRGWRLPSLEELGSLIDPSQSNPALPVGHPFQGINSTQSFWTTSLFSDNTDFAWAVPISNGVPAVKTIALEINVWCVRGGPSVTSPFRIR